METNRTIKSISIVVSPKEQSREIQKLEEELRRIEPGISLSLKNNCNSEYISALGSLFLAIEKSKSKGKDKELRSLFIQEQFKVNFYSNRRGNGDVELEDIEAPAEDLEQWRRADADSFNQLFQEIDVIQSIMRTQNVSRATAYRILNRQLQRISAEGDLFG